MAKQAQNNEAANSNAVAYLLNTARKAPLLVRTISSMALEDPLLFAVQTARRLPKKVRDVLTPATSGEPTALRALAEFVSDQPDRARSTLQELDKRPGSPTRLEAELRIQLGLSTTPGIFPATNFPATNARGAFASGRVAALADSLPPRLARRFIGEERVHNVGTGIQLRPVRTSSTSQQIRSTNDTIQGDRAPSDPIRVFHFLTNSLPWTRSGYTYRSQSVLKAQQAAGIEVMAATRLAYPTLIGRPWAGVDDTVDGISYQRLEPQRLPAGVDARLHLQAQMLTKLVIQNQPDVLQTTTNFHNALTIDAVSRATGIPWVYEMRGNMEQSWIARQPAERREELLESERYVSMRQRETEMARRADHLIVLSTTQREDMIERGIPAKKISVIPNSVDSALLTRPRDTTAAQTSLGLEPGFWVGSVTAVVDYEGLPTLLRSVALLRQRGLPVRAAIVGDGIALPGLRTLASELGIEDAVVMPGRVPQEQALEWYSALDAFVIPRVSTEVTRTVTPMKGVQAMALGVPLVVSDLPALVEVGAKAGQGLVVPPEDPPALANALQSLAENPRLCSDLSAAGRIAAADRTWDAAGQTYLEIYRSLAVTAQ